MPPIPGPLSDADEWREYRTHNPTRSPYPLVFGASTAGALLGVSPYTSRLELWARMTGREVQDESIPMMVGRALEPIVLELYRQQKSVAVTANSRMFFSDTYPLLSATPDGFLSDCPTLVEAKAVAERRYGGEKADNTQFGFEGTDHVPLDYLAQGQHQMAVMDAGEVHLAALFGNSKMRVYYIHRDERLIAILAGAANDMAEYIRSDTPPPMEYGRAGERGLFISAVANDEIVELPDNIEELWVQRCQLRDQAQAYTDEADTIQDRVIEAMGGAAAGVLRSLQTELRRIDVKGCSYTVNRKPYSFYKECKTRG